MDLIKKFSEWNRRQCDPFARREYLLADIATVLVIGVAFLLGCFV